MLQIHRDTVDGRKLANHLGCINLVNNGINYKPQLVQAGFLNHQQYHTSLGHKIWSPRKMVPTIGWCESSRTVWPLKRSLKQDLANRTSTKVNPRLFHADPCCWNMIIWPDEWNMPVWFSKGANFASHGTDRGSQFFRRLGASPPKKKKTWTNPSLAILCDLFLRWWSDPKSKVEWPPTKGSKDQIESPEFENVTWAMKKNLVGWVI